MNLDEKLQSASPEKYGGNYGQHLLEQYTLYVEMADRISHRRQNANGFGLSINTAILGIVGLVASRCTPNQMFTMIAVISVAGMLILEVERCARALGATVVDETVLDRAKNAWSDTLGFQAGLHGKAFS